MSVTAADAAALERCVRAGGVALFGADTVYGLCCDPDDPAAARRIYELKGRPATRPSAVMFFNAAAALELLDELWSHERAAFDALLPGPVTLLLANRRRRFAPACGPDPATLGVRVPALAAAAAALAAVRLPVLQTSANRSGGAEAATLAAVDGAIRAGADIALDAGELPGTASTVIDLRDGPGRWRVVREGALPSARVAELLDKA